ncbi:MAG: hypothetical protein AAF827_19810 [Cyanobacteria bacterium P01_D01_bin.6]
MDYLGGDEVSLERFLVFVELGDRTCTALDRNDYFICYEEKDKLNQTDFSLLDFIEACLKEVQKN